MRMVNIIQKKRFGEALNRQEIEWFVEQYVQGNVPDYQASAFAMAVCFQGMTAQETADLTLAMANSGEVLDWSDIAGVKVDKHSTGGVGDTTTLVLAPWVAAVGVPVAKMSGRGLGHTGGTLDKLESIPGFSTKLTREQFLHQVSTIGLAVAGQTADLAPADKKLYALRDVTATVDSLPLIASSIMSKKLASGADAIVLDVKVGNGAFMKDLEHAQALARAMVSIGRLAGRKVTAVLTPMEEPLGRAIGNALEVREAVHTLRGQGPRDLTELCLTLGAEMVVLGGKAKDEAEARSLLEEALASGAALVKFKEFVTAQGGDARIADDLTLLPEAPVTKLWKAETEGVLMQMDAESLGRIAMNLGAGRATYEDDINPSVGLVIQRKLGERVLAGEPLVEVHAASEEAAVEAIMALQDVVRIQPGDAFTSPLLLGVVRDNDAVLHADVTDSVHKRRQGLVRETGVELLDVARHARESAYVPYSSFAVGAALRLDNGEVITGANVENASYGLTNCAERTAVFRFVTSDAYKTGARIVEVAVIADSDGPVAPCGACRQVLAEFCHPETAVILGDLHGKRYETRISSLLPYAFSAKQMAD